MAKKQEPDFGMINGHLIGFAMKEMVRRAIEAIRAQRFIFEQTVKVVDYKEGEDLVTSADEAAQAIYLRMIREGFPDYGIIAEEDDFIQPCRLKDTNLTFTVDPLDGTKAFGRRQSHGVGTMIALLRNGQVIAAYVGDINTREIYGYRPGSSNVWRISDYEHPEGLAIDTSRTLASQYVLLRDAEHKYSPLVQKMVRSPSEGGLFKDCEVTSGSIGITIARLWKGEVAACIMRPAYQTPWDLAPIVGISRALGFVRVVLQANSKLIWVCRDDDAYEISDKKEHWTSETMLIHYSRVDEFLEWHKTA